MYIYIYFFFFQNFKKLKKSTPFQSREILYIKVELDLGLFIHKTHQQSEGRRGFVQNDVSFFTNFKTFRVSFDRVLGRN